jgi:dienelactone hydrolase
MSGDPSEEPTALSPAAASAEPGQAASFSPGARLDHFELLQRLGSGGFGEVYRVRDLRLDRIVALKVLRAEVVTATLRERLRREAMTASALNHPGICTVHDLVEADGRLAIVMELVEGRTLHARIAAGALRPAEAISIARQLASALGAAHQAGILHRDLKSRNIMVTPDGRVKVLDFGLAKRVDPSGGEQEALTAEGVAVGTLAYMSPEQLRAEPVDRRSDLYSLGVVLYEMLAGWVPFRGSSAIATADAILHSAPPALGPAVVPGRLKAVVGRLLEKDPARRIASAEELDTELADASAQLARQAGRRRRLVGLSAAGVVAVLTAAAAGWLWHRDARVRWARDTALPELTRLVEAEEYAKGAILAQEVRPLLPGDARLEKLWQATNLAASFASEPAGAEVSYRLLGAGKSDWRTVGRTPLSGVRVPKAYALWRVEKPGYRAAYSIWPTWVLRGTGDLSFRLDAEGSVPADMIRVAVGSVELTIPGLDHLPAVHLDDYLIDRTEVTNAQYALFVADGGYSRPELWTDAFVRDGKTLRLDEAMASFRDSTGRPGPSTWELGRYPKGMQDHPVAGVSWYEAAAYARWAGKSLPTVYHWNAAAQTRASHLIVPGSNFTGAGTVPVGGEGALSGFGTTDMAGNVKEWCLNPSRDGKRFILGGGFGEPGYMFIDADSQSPWERRANFGIRCVKLPAAAPPAAAGRLDWISRDFLKEQPVTDDVFRAYRGLYAYDRTPLDARVEAKDVTEDWTHEKASFAAAYGGERVIAHLYLPRNARPPYQTVVLFPGSTGIHVDEFWLSEYASFFPSAGRAVLAPVYKGTFDRRDALRSDYANETAFWRDHVVAWSKDLGRSLDYLESRPEIDSTKVAYVGVSWGGQMAPIMLALHARLRVAVLESAGFAFQRALPEADVLNFITRVKVPVLMLNGRHDHFFPEMASQRPFLQLLGTPAKDKKLVIYETGHAVPRKEFIRESIDWLDRYLGPVQR